MSCPIPYLRGDGRESKEARTLREMVQRCHNPAHRDYPHYGGRGIRVCDQWRGHGGYHQFLADVGPAPSPAHTIDRIDNDGDYAPGNVRWATRAEQNNNRGCTIWLEHPDGRVMPLTVWADLYGIKPGTLRARVCLRGWPLEKALATPVRR